MRHQGVPVLMASKLSRKWTKLFFTGQSIAPILRHAHVCFLHHPLANLLDHLEDTLRVYGINYYNHLEYVHPSLLCPVFSCMLGHPELSHFLFLQLF